MDTDTGYGSTVSQLHSDCCLCFKRHKSLALMGVIFGSIWIGALTYVLFLFLIDEYLLTKCLEPQRRLLRAAIANG